MTKTAALRYIDKVAEIACLNLDPRPFEGIAGVSKGSKGFRNGPNVFVAVFYGGRDPGVRVTVKDKLRRFGLDADPAIVAGHIQDRMQGK